MFFRLLFRFVPRPISVAVQMEELLPRESTILDVHQVLCCLIQSKIRTSCNPVKTHSFKLGLVNSPQSSQRFRAAPDLLSYQVEVDLRFLPSYLVALALRQPLGPAVGQKVPLRSHPQPFLREAAKCPRFSLDLGVELVSNHFGIRCLCIALSRGNVRTDLLSSLSMAVQIRTVCRLNKSM